MFVFGRNLSCLPCCSSAVFNSIFYLLVLVSGNGWVSFKFSLNIAHLIFLRRCLCFYSALRSVLKVMMKIKSSGVLKSIYFDSYS